MNAIKLKKLSFSWAERSLLCSLSAELKSNSFAALIGPNGAGKTTLLELLMGFLDPQEGQIEILGKTPREARTEIGYVPQLRLFDKDYPITLKDLVLGGLLKNKRFGCSYSKEEKLAAKQALEEVGLGEIENRPFGKLSGGQMQRGLLARALISKPKLLLLDEPVSNIDPAGQKQILEILKKLKGVSILMVSHNLQTVTEYVDTVWCLDEYLSITSPDKICGHFAMGLYHPPVNLKESS